MKSFIAAALVSLVCMISVKALTVNSPSDVVQCEPCQITWSGGTAPYYVSILPGGNSMGTPIDQFPTQSGNSYTWNVNITTGTTFTIACKDSTGAIAYSAEQTVLSSPNSACTSNNAGQGSSSSSSSASVSDSSAPSSSSGAPVASSAPTSSPHSSSGSPGGTSSNGAPHAASSSSPAAASSSPSTAGGSTTQSNDGMHATVSSAFGVAAVMGLVGAVLV